LKEPPFHNSLGIVEAQQARRDFGFWGNRFDDPAHNTKVIDHRSSRG
jgi:hypothetical protein